MYARSCCYLMMNFKLMKFFIFLCFHKHINSKSNHFSSIFKSLNFRVLHGAGGGRSSSNGRRDERLLAEAEYAELVGDEVQTPEEEGLEWHEDRRSPHPIKWERGKLQRAEANRIARARHAEDGGKVVHPMTKKRTASSPWTAPTIGVKSNQQVNICSFAMRCDRMWPSTQ